MPSSTKRLENHVPLSIKALITIAGLCTGATSVVANPCVVSKPDLMAGFTPKDAFVFLDLPDRYAARATATLEGSFVDRVIAEEIRSFSKSWCQIGLQTMILDFDTPVEDDAIGSVLTRAVYVWDTQSDPVGWRIDQLGDRNVCARGDDPFAAICP